MERSGELLAVKQDEMEVSDVRDRPRKLWKHRHIMK